MKRFGLFKQMSLFKKKRGLNADQVAKAYEKILNQGLNPETQKDKLLIFNYFSQIIDCNLKGITEEKIWIETLHTIKSNIYEKIKPKIKLEDKTKNVDQAIAKQIESDFSDFLNIKIDPLVLNLKKSAENHETRIKRLKEEVNKEKILDPPQRKLSPTQTKKSECAPKKSPPREKKTEPPPPHYRLKEFPPHLAPF